MLVSSGMAHFPFNTFACDIGHAHDPVEADLLILGRRLLSPLSLGFLTSGQGATILPTLKRKVAYRSRSL